MIQYGLIGKKLGHSKSPELFRTIFQENNVQNAAYSLFELNSIEETEHLIQQHKNLKGFNVTTPFKHEILSKLSSIDAEAEKIGAVNTVKIQRNSDSYSLHGYNTDAPAFEQSLKLFCNNLKLKALVLGSGGAAKAVTYVLKKNDIQFIQVSREQKQGFITYHEITAEMMNDSLLIVNCTPSGMWPDTSQLPAIPYFHLTSKHYLYDLIYNPAETLFLQKGKEIGCRLKNGYEMLKLQALKSFEIWQSDES